MTGRSAARDRFHFRRLTLENVRSFGGTQSLDLTDSEGKTSMWNLILGENGVGKTTLLQVLARMRPIPAFSRDINVSDPNVDVGEPLWAEPELSLHENPEIQGFVRTGKGRRGTSMDATLEDSRGHLVEVGVRCKAKAGKLSLVEFRQAERPLAAQGPLVIAYGAARRVGHGNATALADQDPVEPLFGEGSDLVDAEEILGLMHYASSTGDERDRSRFDAMVGALADLIPEAVVTDIEVRGPRMPGRAESLSGVHVRTPSGVVPLSALSHGYQTVIAWTVDLAWRMLKAYPETLNPLHEAAVVLVDEIDLHLHPRWQRSLRRHLVRHFPGIQFIATTHSPITAQETLSAGGKVSVVRWEGEQATILNDPLPSRDWRLDQVLTSELFGFDSSRGPDAEKKMNERLALLRKAKLTPSERARLKELDTFVAGLPTASTRQEQAFEDLMRRVSQYEGVPAS